MFSLSLWVCYNCYVCSSHIIYYISLNFIMYASIIASMQHIHSFIWRLSCHVQSHRLWFMWFYREVTKFRFWSLYRVGLNFWLIGFLNSVILLCFTIHSANSTAGRGFSPTAFGPVSPLMGSKSRMLCPEVGGVLLGMFLHWFWLWFMKCWFIFCTQIQYKWDRLHLGIIHHHCLCMCLSTVQIPFMSVWKCPIFL